MSGLILASTSASRRAILEAAGVAFTAMAPEVDEDAAKAKLLSAGAGPLDIAMQLADLKAIAVSRRHSGLVIGADQTLELGGALIDKPGDLAEARATLEALRGRTHRLHSAVVVASGGEALWRDVVTARLTMWPFSDAFLDRYLADQGDRVLSSVGAYLIEGRGIQLFEEIDGDHFAILGLPLLPLLNYLRAAAADRVESV